MKTGKTFFFFAIPILIFLILFLFSHLNEYKTLKRTELSRQPSADLIKRHSLSVSPLLRLAAVKAAYRAGSGPDLAGMIRSVYQNESDTAVKREAAFGMRYFPSLHEWLFEAASNEDDIELKAILLDSFGFALTPGEVQSMMGLLGISPESDKAVFIALGNISGQDGPSGWERRASKKLNSLVDTYSGTYFMYALSQYGFSAESEKALLSRYADLGEWERYYLIKKSVSTAVLRALFERFPDMTAQQKTAYTERAASYPRLRKALYALNEGNGNLTALLLAHETDKPFIARLVAASESQTVKESGTRRLLTLGDAAFMRANAEDIHVKRHIGLAPEKAVRSVFGNDGLMGLTDDDDYIVRRNAYSLLAEHMPETVPALFEKAAGDIDFTVRLTGYELLYAHDRDMFKEQALLRYAAETSPDIREFLIGMLSEAGFERSADTLLAGESDPYVVNAYKKGAIPVRFLKYNNDDFKIKVVTSRGDIVMECYGSEAPHNVENIIRLVRKGFYKGVLFHRVALNHVIQAGDPHGDGWGGSRPPAMAEYSRLTYDEAGTVGIADRGKDTGSSQFFITLTPRFHLNGRYTVIARVTEGMDTVESIEPGDEILSVSVVRAR